MAGKAGSCVAVVGALCGLQVFAQDASKEQGLLVTPRVSVSERFTNNATLVNTGKRSEFYTQVSPGIGVRSNGGVLKGSLDYSLNGLYHANKTAGDTLQNALTTSWILEAVDNWAFVDFGGSISQQVISAFGTRAADTFRDTPNSTEVASYRVSPYLRGDFSGLMSYEARLSFVSTAADSQAASDVRAKGGVLRLNGRPRGPLGWGLDASSDRTNYTLARSIQSDQLRGRVNYTVNPQVNAYVILGRESNNFSTVDKESHSFHGVGVNWIPSERTKFAANVESHSYGRSYGLSFEHRTPRTAWRVSDSQSVANSGAQPGTTAIGTLAGLLDSQFASLEPDPLRRAALVSNYLLANGYNPNALVLSNFLSSTASLRRNQEISFSLLGVRDTVNFVLSRSSNRRLSNLTTAFDDLSSVDNVSQSGFGVSYLHRLTPDTSFNVGLTRQNTGSSGNFAGSSLRSLDVILSSRLGRQTFASVGARRSFFDSLTSPYTETTLTGSVSLQF
jgi:uncharacterized protein (PEP-CTERM system associated)